MYFVNEKNIWLLYHNSVVAPLEENPTVRITIEVTVVVIVVSSSNSSVVTKDILCLLL